MMEARIQKWGNSLALRIPQAFAAEAGLSQNTPVELTLEEGRLVIKPIPAHPYRLEDLLTRITPDNLHGETASGDRLGNETW
jgi:antitoxin MazE